MKNLELINSPLNLTFDQTLKLSTDHFRLWCVELRKLVVDLWDNKGLPPVMGYSDEEIVDQFKQLESFITDNMLIRDELTRTQDVVRNTHNLGNSVNSFFPTMMKTRINYSNKDNGKSIYDFFACDDLLERFITYANRHFKRDSFYHYSIPVKFNDRENYDNYPVAECGSDWIVDFETNYRARNAYDYWFCPIDDTKTYSGYNEEIKNRNFLTITRAEIGRFSTNFGQPWGSKPIPAHCFSNLNIKSDFDLCQIRVFKKRQKLFPIGFKAFKISFAQYAVNFPPLTAKYIYEHYTEQFKQDDVVVVWDPSAGWGGRLLGALSTKPDRHLLYLANDPNTDHNIENNQTKYHRIYDFYCKNIIKGGRLFPLPHNDFQFWQKGSEVMQFDPDFQKYKGKVSLVFTSPPYFAKEAYSEDEEQSYKKFTSYELWKNGFLFETIKTAYEWLRPGGYLIWNISDVKFGQDMLPLVDDSVELAKNVGFKFVETLKMSLVQMPGGNRIGDDGIPKAKYTYFITKGKKKMWMKYEPILCFQKAV